MREREQTHLQRSDHDRDTQTNMSESKQHTKRNSNAPYHTQHKLATVSLKRLSMVTNWEDNRWLQWRGDT